MPAEAQIRQVLSSLTRAIKQDRRLFVTAARDPSLGPVRADVNRLLDQLTEEAKALAGNQIATAESALGEMEEWHADEAAGAQCHQARTAMAEARRNFQTHSYFGYLDAIPLAQEARREAQLATHAQKSSMRTMIEELQAQGSRLRQELSSYLDYTVVPTQLRSADKQLREAQDRFHVESYTNYKEAESAFKKGIGSLVELFTGLRLEAKRAQDRQAKLQELVALHLALGLLLLSVALGISPFISAAMRSVPLIFLAFASPLPLALADSVWNLGKKQPRSDEEKLSGDYLWLILLGSVGGFVSLVWIFVSYPASLKAIRKRYPDV